MLSQLIGNIYDHRNSNYWSANLRTQRFSLFNKLMDSISNQRVIIKIIDVGGVADFWEKVGFFDRNCTNIEITTININPFYEHYNLRHVQ